MLPLCRERPAGRESFQPDIPNPRSLLMVRAVVCALFSAVLVVGAGTAVAKDKDDKKTGKAVKSQMVKGTIKLVDPAKNLLIVNQKVKNEVVQRELSILETTQFVIMRGNDKEEADGKEGLELLVGKEGASVQVKCDKDVNVLKVTVKLKK
jgi:hypothetical protein